MLDVSEGVLGAILIIVDKRKICYCLELIYKGRQQFIVI